MWRSVALVLALAGCGVEPSATVDAGDDSAAGAGDMASAPDLPGDDLRAPRDLLPPPPDLVPPRFRFADPAPVPVGAQPLHVLLVDLDSDGVLDLVTANYGDRGRFPSTVSVLIGSGDGRFRARAALDVAAGANGSVAADFDKDGKLDLAVTSFDDNRLSTFLGNGDGTFRTGPATSPGFGPSFVAAGDFNGDGAPDVTVPLNTENQVSILRGLGDGSFAMRTVLSAGVDPFSVAVADLDADRHLDVIVASALSGTVHVLRGAGDGTFSVAGVRYDVGATASHVILADFDRNGRLDVAVANGSEHSASVLLGNGDGTLQKEQRLQSGNGSGSLCAGDFDGDGVLDLAVAVHDQAITANDVPGKVTLHAGRGDGTFESQRDLACGPGPFFIACGDLDGDRLADIVVVSDTGFLARVMLNQTGK